MSRCRWVTRMKRQIVIDFAPEQGGISTLDRVRNFGEALYVAFRHEGWATISLEEIDRATTQLRVAVNAPRWQGQVMATIEKLLARHGFAETARIRRE